MSSRGVDPASGVGGAGRGDGTVVFGHAHPGGAQEAIFDQVAGLDDLHDGAGFFSGAGGFEQDFVEIGVEGLIKGVDLGNAMFFEGPQKFLLHCADTVDDATQTLVGCGQVGGNCLKGAVKIVGKIQQVAGKSRHGVFTGILAFLDGAFAGILGVSQRPEEMVLHPCEFGFQRGGPVGSRFWGRVRLRRRAAIFRQRLVFQFRLVHSFYYLNQSYAPGKRAITVRASPAA